MLNNRELVRINPEAIQIEEIRNETENSYDIKMVDAENLVYFQTNPLRVVLYLLEMSLAYKLKTILVSEPHAGKTTLCKKMINKLIKRNLNLVCYVKISSKIESNWLQSIIENKLKLKNAQSQLKQNNCFIFVDDLNMG